MGAREKMRLQISHPGWWYRVVFSTHRTFPLWVHPGRQHGSCSRSSSCPHNHPPIKKKKPTNTPTTITRVSFCLGQLANSDWVRSRCTNKMCSPTVCFLCFTAAARLLLSPPPREEDFEIPHLLLLVKFLPVPASRIRVWLQSAPAQGGRQQRRKWNWLCKWLFSNNTFHRKTHTQTYYKKSSASLSLQWIFVVNIRWQNR